MKIFQYYLGILMAFNKVVDAQPATPQATPNALIYKITKEGNDMKVHLILNGGVYTSSNHCLIKKSNADSNDFEDINPCPNTDQAHGSSKCVMICNGDTNKLTFDKFSPRKKYVAVFNSDTAQKAAEKTTGATVFGFEIRTPYIFSNFNVICVALLVNPQVTITTSESKLKLSVKTCKNVACPIFYKGAQYVDGTAGNTCVEDNRDNEVKFNLMIPHYEMKCTNYPSFFYHLHNNYTLTETGVYIPQYYLKYKKREKNKYMLTFSNKFPHEICRFGIKLESTSIAEGDAKDYTSNCGLADKDCYAPCNDVELTFEESKSVVEILIQTRHFQFKKSGTTYFGYKQKKFVISETIAEDGSGELVSNSSPTGVTIDVRLFNPANKPKFSSCTVTYYPADEPTPADANTKAKCAVNNNECEKTCASALTISQLEGGRPYILQITAAADDSNNDVPNSYKEHIFFRTEKKDSTTFPEATITKQDTSFSIKALSTDGEVTKSDDTCTYYHSQREKNVYVFAKCVDSYPCRGYCKESQSIVGLTPGTEYDLKVIAHKDYGYKIHQITTEKSTLALDKQFLANGFKVIGTLTSPYPEARCHYNVKVKNGETYKTVFECPAQPLTKTSESSILEAGFYKVGVARSTSQQISNKTPNTKAASGACETLPLCNDIIFTEGYEAGKEYQVSVIAFGRSSEVQIIIPSKPTPTSENPTVQLTVTATLADKTINIQTTLPTSMDENSFCRWQLKNLDEPSKPILKQCMVLVKGVLSCPIVNHLKSMKSTILSIIS